MERRIVTVFGGSGFIGRYVVRRLAADDWIVRVAVRDPESAAFLKVAGDPGQVVPLAADIADEASVARATEGVGAVVNLVGILYERGRRTFRRMHVEGAANVARAAHAAGAGRLVQLSAIGADADSPAEYGRTKAAGEKAAAEAFPVPPSFARRLCSARRTTSSIVSPGWRASCQCCRCFRRGSSRSGWGTSPKPFSGCSPTATPPARPMNWAGPR